MDKFEVFFAYSSSKLQVQLNQFVVAHKGLSIVNTEFSVTIDEKGQTLYTVLLHYKMTVAAA